MILTDTRQRTLFSLLARRAGPLTKVVAKGDVRFWHLADIQPCPLSGVRADVASVTAMLNACSR